MLRLRNEDHEVGCDWVGRGVRTYRCPQCEHEMRLTTWGSAERLVGDSGAVPRAGKTPTSISTTGASSRERHHLPTQPYGLGETRVATLALLTFRTLSGPLACGVVITNFSVNSVTLRSSPTVFADTPMSGATSIRIASGNPPRTTWSAAMLFGLYLI